MNICHVSITNKLSWEHLNGTNISMPHMNQHTVVDGAQTSVMTSTSEHNLTNTTS